MANRTQLATSQLKSVADQIFGNCKPEQVAKRSAPRAQRIAQDAHVSIQQPGGTQSQWQACTLDVSARGVGLLIDTFVHPGSPMRLSLLTASGDRRVLEGRAVESQHVVRRLHRVGMRLDCTIDPEEFVLDPREVERLQAHEPRRTPSLQGRVLVLTDSSAQMMMISHWLRDTGVVVVQSPDIGACVSQVRNVVFEVVIVDADTVPEGAEEALARLRHANFAGAAIVLSSDPQLLERDLGECTALAKPLTPSTLLKALRSAIAEANGMRDTQPVRSSLPRSTETDPIVARFAREAADAGNALLRAASHNDRAGVLAMVRRLEGTGAMFGYEILSERAAELRRELADHQTLAPCTRSLHRFAALCARVGEGAPRLAA